jgi:non-specific serine/threonine protein kinase
LLDATLPEFEAAGDVGGYAYSLFFQANGASFLGAYERAADQYGRAEAIFREIGDTWGLVWTLANRGHLDHLRGDEARSEQGYVEGLALAHQLGALWVIDTCLRGLAMTASTQGRADRAVRLFAAAEVLHGATGTTMPEPARVVYERRLEQARAALGSRAADRAWEGGLSLTTDQAVALALSTEPSPGPTDAVAQEASRPSDSPLSPRELEVAALVGRGLTNRQIAEQLVLSERTVHSHVGTILRKLDLSTRALIAVWAAERGLVSRLVT